MITKLKKKYTKFYICQNCGEPHDASELPPTESYYKNETNSLFYPCKICGGAVRSKTGKVIGVLHVDNNN